MRDLYLHVGNGGFGPRVLGLDNGWQDGCQHDTAIGHYLDNQAMCVRWMPEKWYLLEKFLPIAYGGCTIYYLLDCNSEDGAVLQWNAAGLEEHPARKIVAASLREWLEQWLDDKIHQREAYGISPGIDFDEIPF